MLTECLAGFLVTAGLWLLLGSASRGRTVLGALVLGCLPMCNEVMVYLPVVVAVVIWLRDRRRAVVVFLVAMLPLALWHVRNQSAELVRHGSERATASISHGSYPDMVFHDPRYRGFPYREDAEQPAFGKSWAGLWRVLLPRVRQEPLRYLQWYVLEKPQWLWRWPLVQGTDVYVYPVRNSPYDHHAMMAASYACMRWLHLPVMMLGLLVAGFGVLVGRRESSWALQALGCIAITGTLAYLPVIPDPRYLQPIRPLLFLLAATALPLCLRWWRSREGRRGPKPASGI